MQGAVLFIYFSFVFYVFYNQFRITHFGKDDEKVLTQGNHTH